MTDELDVELIGNWLPGQQFELQEAIGLLHSEAIRVQDRAYLQNPPIEKIGIICGVLTMNDEVEIIIRFPEGILQLNKSELYSDYLLVEDNDK